MKKLYRSEHDRWVLGILGGLGEYLEIDPTVLRLVWLLVVVFTGIVPGVVVYFAAALIVPRVRHHTKHYLECPV